MSYVIVLADRIHEANRYAKQVQLPKGRWRFPSSAGSIRGLRVAEIHELPSFAIRRDRFALESALRYARGERKIVFTRPELTDELVDEAYAENDSTFTLTSEQLMASVVSIEHLAANVVSSDPRGPLTERQLEVAYRYNVLRELGLDALGDPDDDEDVCGETYDHDFPEPEYVDGVASLVCRRCGGEIFVEEEPTAPVEKPKQRRRSKCPTCGELDFKDTHACPVAMRPTPTAASMFDED